MYDDDAYTVRDLLNNSKDRWSDREFVVDARRNPILAWPITIHDEVEFILAQEKPLLVYRFKLTRKLIQLERDYHIRNDKVFRNDGQ